MNSNWKWIKNKTVNTIFYRHKLIKYFKINDTTAVFDEYFGYYFNIPSCSVTSWSLRARLYSNIIGYNNDDNNNNNDDK